MRKCIVCLDEEIGEIMLECWKKIGES